MALLFGVSPSIDWYECPARCQPEPVPKALGRTLAFFCRLDPVAAMVVDGAALDSPAATPTMKGSRLFFGICCCLTTTSIIPPACGTTAFRSFLRSRLAGYWVSSVFNPEVLDLKQRGAMGLVLKWTMTLSSAAKFATALRISYIS
jgi:hypothetical protein